MCPVFSVETLDHAPFTWCLKFHSLFATTRSNAIYSADARRNSSRYSPLRIVEKKAMHRP
jgi:hypothetical protein